MVKCRVPGCSKRIPEWRDNKGIRTCSKRCSNAWNHISWKQREKIRGKKYG